MFCPKCGNEVQEGSAFCGNCGASVATATVAVATTKAGKKKGPIAIVAVIVAVVIAVVIGVNLLGGSGVAVKDSTEAYTWEELSKISGEIGKARDEGAAVEIAKKYNLTTKDGKLDGTQTKSVTLSNGVQTAVQIVGFAHDEKADGGKAGITFIFKDCIGERSMNPTETNAGGWEKSEMRSYLNSEGLSLLPSDLRQKIVTVDKLTNNVGETRSASPVTPTSDQLWLFSLAELTGAFDQSEFNSEYGYLAGIYNAEGSQYKLFRDMSVHRSSNRTLEKTVYEQFYCCWWERSPYPSTSDIFDYVYSDGNPYHGGGATDSYGVCPVFCI